MRRAVSAGAPKGAQIGRPFFFPAPTGGMNTRDPSALLPLNESPAMQDCYPTTTGIAPRKTYANHTTGMPAQTRALMVYSTPGGTETLFAASGTAFYNVTSAGAVGAAVVSGLTNATWEHVNFTNSSGTSYLCTFNGVDSPRYWDNATWTAITGVSTPAITGLTTTTIASAFVYQRRMWLVQASSLKVWYLPADSVGGAAAALDLGGIASEGGYIVAGSTWTVDGGAGIDDYLVVVTSAGQMIAFQGTDPSSASTWLHIGTWNIPAPVGRRCLFRHKGDLLIITEAGIASAARIMRGETTTSSMITDKIRLTYSLTYTSAASTGDLLWQLAYHPGTDLLHWCPNASYGGHSIPLNAATGAWGGGYTLYAICMTVFNGDLYFAPRNSDGTAGTTIRKLTGGSDESTLSPYLWLAYSDFGYPGVIKKTMQGRVAGAISGSSPQVMLMSEADYYQDANGSLVTLTGFSGMSPWLPLRAIGVSIRLRTSFEVPYSTTTFEIYGFFVTYQLGGLMGSSSVT